MKTFNYKKICGKSVKSPIVNHLLKVVKNMLENSENNKNRYRF